MEVFVATLQQQKNAFLWYSYHAPFVDCDALKFLIFLVLDPWVLKIVWYKNR